MVSEDEPDASAEAARAAASEAAGGPPAPFRPNLDADEPVRATVRCPAGYDCPDGPTDSVADPVVLGVTDRRVLVVPDEGEAAGTRPVGEEAEEATAADAVTAADAATLSLPFTALGAVSLIRGREPVLELVSADKVTYRFPLPPGDGSHASAVADLRWLGEVRGRVLATSQEVLTAADRIEARGEAGDSGPALEIYDRARAVLDRLLDTVHATTPLTTAVLAPDLTEVERALEAAVTRAYVARSGGHLDDAAAAVEDHDLEVARTALEAARDDRDAAERHASEVFTREEFRFGLERDLEEELRELGWEIEAVAADPIRRAQEAVVEAQAADDPAVAAERYEDAIEDFRGLLPLGWREGARQFDGDPTAVRADLARVGERLLACYRTLAERERETMAERAAADDRDGASAACEQAAAHLERARELAVEFAPGAVDDVDDALSALRDQAETLSQNSAAGPDAGDVTVEGADGAPADAGGATGEDAGGAREDASGTTGEEGDGAPEGGGATGADTERDGVGTPDAGGAGEGKSDPAQTGDIVWGADEAGVGGTDDDPDSTS